MNKICAENAVDNKFDADNDIKEALRDLNVRRNRLIKERKEKVKQDTKTSHHQKWKTFFRQLPQGSKFTCSLGQLNDENFSFLENNVLEVETLNSVTFCKFESLALHMIPLKRHLFITNFHNVLELVLNDCGLTELPEELILLTQMKNIHLSNNQLTAVNCSRLPTALRHLDVSKNKIFTLNQIDSLFNLSELNFSQNQLRSFENKLPVTLKIANFSRNALLVSLKLSSDWITLDEIIADYCQISSLTFESKELNIYKLSLRGNKLVALPESIGMLQNLRTLDLGFNHLQTLPKGLSTIKLLEKLRVDGNPLIDPFNIMCDQNSTTSTLVKALRVHFTLKEQQRQQHENCQELVTIHEHIIKSCLEAEVCFPSEGKNEDHCSKNLTNVNPEQASGHFIPLDWLMSTNIVAVQRQNVISHLKQKDILGPLGKRVARIFLPCCKCLNHCVPVAGEMCKSEVWHLRRPQFESNCIFQLHSFQLQRREIKIETQKFCDSLERQIQSSAWKSLHEKEIADKAKTLITANKFLRKKTNQEAKFRSKFKKIKAKYAKKLKRVRNSEKLKLLALNERKKTLLIKFELEKGWERKELEFQVDDIENMIFEVKNSVETEILIEKKEDELDGLKKSYFHTLFDKSVLESIGHDDIVQVNLNGLSFKTADFAELIKLNYCHKRLTKKEKHQIPSLKAELLLHLQETFVKNRLKAEENRIKLKWSKIRHLNVRVVTNVKQLRFTQWFKYTRIQKKIRKDQDEKTNRKDYLRVANRARKRYELEKERSSWSESYDEFYQCPVWINIHSGDYSYETPACFNET